MDQEDIRRISNPDRKLTTNRTKEILHCFENGDINDQALINLFDRGSLRCITNNKENIFTKAEYEIRRNSTKNPDGGVCKKLISVKL